jgi:pre-rRNA-processing protein TSR3
MIFDYHQDDPRKCTSTKLEKLRLAEPLHNLRQIPRSAIVLNPVSNRTLSFQDQPSIQKYGLVGLDCSWNKADTVFQDNIKGDNRRLPTLLAGNPTNYSIRGRLTTVEALAAALIITGFDKRGRELLDAFNWGDTFLTLNIEPLREYAQAPEDQMFSREREFFPTE